MQLQSTITYAIYYCIGPIVIYKTQVKTTIQQYRCLEPFRRSSGMWQTDG